VPVEEPPPPVEHLEEDHFAHSITPR